MTGTLRAAIAQAIDGVVTGGHSLDASLERLRRELHDPRERAFAQECLYGVLRWYHRLDFQLGLLLKRPLRQRDSNLQMLLLAGLYQLWYLNVPAHAVVSETVAASASLSKPWAKALTNAVLRSAQRRQTELEALPQATRVAAWSHPAWIIDRVRADWPDAWQQLLAGNNAHAPLTLRVNRHKTTRENYRRLLATAGIEAEPTAHASYGLQLAKPVPVEQLPSFHDGLITVQDEAAQLAATLLAAEAGHLVLDACAAPGGKTAHIIESAPQDVRVTAIDIARDRVEMIADTMTRLGLGCELLCADVAATAQWWRGTAFDRILLDAPCSASGVIRRHPDIKLNRREADIAPLAALQRDLLGALWPVLKSGGKLLYATCSIFSQENDEVLAAFLENTRDAACEPIEAKWGHATSHGRRILSGQDHMDGFYYALIRKQ